MNTLGRSISAADRSGFTLVELLIVAVVLGILAGLAIPNLKQAIYQADAASIVADMNAVRFAVAEYFEDNARYPSQSRWGQMPADLRPYLGDMEFRHKDLDFRLWSGARVSFNVRFSRNHPIGEALKRYRRPGAGEGSVNWTPTRTQFRLACDSSRMTC